MPLSKDDIAKLYAAMPAMTADEQAETLEMLEELDRREHAELCRNDFIEFVKFMNEDYEVGVHHRKLAQLLEDLAYGREDRIAVSMGPRFGKSLLISEYFPAWYLGKYPKHKIIMASHTGDLAVDFGRKVRDLVGSDKYRQIFPSVELSADSKAAGKWNTSKGGEYFATGVGAALAGRGAHLCVSLQSKVITRTGAKSADDVQIGEELLGETGFGAVSAKFYTTHKQTTYINHNTGTTPEHPFFVVGKGYTPAKEVKVGDYLLTTRIYVKVWSSLTNLGVFKWVKAHVRPNRLTTSGL